MSTEPPEATLGVLSEVRPVETRKQGLVLEAEGVTAPAVPGPGGQEGSGRRGCRRQKLHPWGVREISFCKKMLKEGLLLIVFYFMFITLCKSTPLYMISVILHGVIMAHKG